MSQIDAGPAATSGYDELHRLGLFAGELPAAVLDAIPPLIAATPDERARLTRDGLAELRAHDVLTDAEVAQISTVLGHLRAADMAPAQQAEAAAGVLQELVDADAGPLALAIVGIAATSSRAVATRIEELSAAAAGRGPDGSDGLAADIGDVSTWQEAACVGGIVGATAGLLGGPAGVLAGAAAGAAGGVIAFVAAEALLA